MAINCFEVTRNDGPQREVIRWPGMVRVNEPWPDGAYCPVGSDYNSEAFRERSGTLVMWQTHKGFCLYEYEANGRDDSDFFMMVWNPEKNQPEPICFASTRGWTYPAYGSQPDATPDVVEAWEAYKANEKEKVYKANRKAKADHLRSIHKLELALTAKHGIKLSAIRKFRRTEMPERFARAWSLINSTKIRSTFRKSLQAQLIAWLKYPKHNSPFSLKQWDYI